MPQGLIKFHAVVEGQQIILTNAEGQPVGRLNVVTSEEATQELAAHLEFSVASFEVLPIFAQ